MKCVHKYTFFLHTDIDYESVRSAIYFPSVCDKVKFKFVTVELLRCKGAVFCIINDKIQFLLSTLFFLSFNSNSSLHTFTNFVDIRREFVWKNNKGTNSIKKFRGLSQDLRLLIMNCCFCEFVCIAFNTTTIRLISKFIHPINFILVLVTF